MSSSEDRADPARIEPDQSWPLRSEDQPDYWPYNNGLDQYLHSSGAERRTFLDREEYLDRLHAAEAEAARDQRERNDPDTSGMVQARDQRAASGRFDDADATQRLIDSIRERSEVVRYADAVNARADQSLQRSAGAGTDHRFGNREVRLTGGSRGRDYPEVTRGDRGRTR